jgi:hypothetical protein
VALLSRGPVGHLEALEEGARTAVELNLSHTLKQRVRVEILSEDVVLDVGLLVEFIAIEVLNTNTYIILK